MLLIMRWVSQVFVKKHLTLLTFSTQEAFSIVVDKSQEVFLDSTSGRIVLRSGNCAPDSSPLENYDNQQCERPLNEE